MMILLTNEYLDQRPGADAITRELARSLQRLGHFVIAYTSDLRVPERMLERDAIPVATDLHDFPVRPDIIHARHHLDAMSAVAALPGVPAIYQCTAPFKPAVLPRHPRIYRYAVPSAAIAEEWTASGEVPGSAIDVIPSAADLSRLVRRHEPAQRPRRALIYDAHRVPGSSVVEEIRAVTAAMGIGLDVLGRSFGRVTDNPELRLPEYDVVFACGRAAVEALACGCSVIVLGEAGCGELVCDDNFERLRLADFTAPFDVSGSAEIIRAGLEQSSEGAGAGLAEKVRRNCDIAHSGEALQAIYQAAIAAHERAPPDPEAEQRAVSLYLYELVAALKQLDDQQKVSTIPLATIAMWLDTSAQLLALQAEMGRPQW